jgi:3-isopropylmalate/(R)-2-methylmalate dehydratase small subunit
MEAFSILTSSLLALPNENIDTDQIIPARFLTVTDFEGIGEHAFADWRYDASGAPLPDHVLNQPWARQRRILVAGDNFGCGSSREHAPRALLGFGFRVVMSTRIADIFRNNALTCGLLAIEIGVTEQTWMLNHPEQAVTVDLQQQFVELAGGHRYRFKIDLLARNCLLQGTDPLGFLLQHKSAIEDFEEARR